MSISSDTQNLNEKQFTPDYGTDDNGIQYSCGHINPLQRALVNNGVAKLNEAKEKLQNAIDDINNFNDDIMEFAKTRCEEVRAINSELRSAVDNYECNCLDDYECSRCEDLESEKCDLETLNVELKDKIEDLENALLSANVKIQELYHSFKNLEKL